MKSQRVTRGERYVAVLRPVMLVDHVFDDVDTEGTVLRRQHYVEKEQLPDDVDNIADFVKQEENYKIIAEPVQKHSMYDINLLLYKNKKNKKEQEETE